MAEVRVGIFGAGSIAAPNIEGLLKHPNAKIVAICATSPKCAEPLAERFQIPRRYYRVEQINMVSILRSLIRTTNELLFF